MKEETLNEIPEEKEVTIINEIPEEQLSGDLLIEIESAEEKPKKEKAAKKAPVKKAKTDVAKKKTAVKKTKAEDSPVEDAPVEYTSAQKKKLLGQYSKRTLQARFGIKF